MADLGDNLPELLLQDLNFNAGGVVGVHIDNPDKSQEFDALTAPRRPAEDSDSGLTASPQQVGRNRPSDKTSAR